MDGNGEVTWKEMEEAATEILRAQKAEKAKNRLLSKYLMALEHS